MELSKMNNHEHRTKQTYESYTFQPLMSFCYYSVGIREKQSGTVEHSKNDYHERSKQVPKDWHSGDFDVKWQEKELHKQRQKCFKAFG